jgi:hypothetical protein
MKKFLGAVVALALILAALYFGVRFATEAKAREALAKLMELAEIEDWSVGSAYINPLNQSLVANNFKASKDDSEFSVKKGTVKGFLAALVPDATGEIEGSIKINKLLFSAEDSDFGFDLLSASGVIDLAQLQEQTNFVKQLKGLEINNFSVSVSGNPALTLESLKGSADYISGIPADSDMDAKNLVIYASPDEKYRVEKITVTSSNTDGLNKANITADSKNLFLLNISYTLSGLEELESYIAESAMGTLELLDKMKFNNFELNYTDRSLVNVLLDKYSKEADSSREEVISTIEAAGVFLAMSIKNGNVLASDFVAFLKDPKKIALKSNPEEPISLAALDDLNAAKITVSFNDGTEFLLEKADGSYYQEDYYDDYDEDEE